MSQHDTQELDNTLTRMFSKLPKQPYVLDIPSDAPSPVHPYQVNWEYRVGTNFSGHELLLQHASFLNMNESSSLLRAQEIDLIAATSPPKPAPAASSGPKKKISLADYKTRAQNKGAPSPAQPQQRQVEREQASHEPVEGQMGGVEPSRLFLKPVSFASGGQNWSIQLAREAGIKVSKRKNIVQRVETLGKALKAEYQAKFESSNDLDSTRKLSLVLGIESVLCFMQSFNYRAGAHRLWPTLFQLQDQLAHRTRNLPHLNGLCQALNASCALRYQAVLATIPYRDLTTEKSLNDHFEAINRSQSRAQKSILQANQLLTHHILEEQYPATFQVFQQLGLVLMDPKAAVKVGIAFLKEWAAQEGVQWKLSLDEKRL